MPRLDSREIRAVRPRKPRLNDGLGLGRRSRSADIHLCALQVSGQDDDGARPGARNRTRRRARHPDFPTGGWRAHGRRFRPCIRDVNRRMSAKWPFTCFEHDLVESPVPGRFDGIYALDVLEQIRTNDEENFLGNMLRSLAPHHHHWNAVTRSQPHAAPISRAGHAGTLCCERTSR
jgi:hypothetical protein